jgi:signal transduction histidine kinase
MDSLRKGRGMRNMPKRMKNIKGTFLVLPQQQGTLVELKVPIGIILQPTQSTWKRNLNYVFSRFKLNQK